MSWRIAVTRLVFGIERCSILCDFYARPQNRRCDIGLRVMVRVHSYSGPQDIAGTNCRHLYELQTFRAQDLSFPRTNSPYGELSFRRHFVPGNFRSLPWNFRSRALSFSGTFVPGGTKVPGNFRSPDLPRNFRSQDFSFPGTFVPPTILYKALAMNADSYSNCQNLFRSRPSSVCFPKIN